MSRREKKPPEPMSPEIEELFAQVYADPDDDSARLVLSDALIERRDPRGDFIVMQFGRASGRAIQANKEMKLLRQFQTKWLGVLHECVRYPVFERGFLAKCSVDPSKMKSVIGAREWTTVRDLDLGSYVYGADKHDVTPLLLSEPIRMWTRHLRNMTGPMAVEAFQCPELRRWRSIEITAPSVHALSRAYQACTPANMPALRTLQITSTFDVESVDRLLQGAVTPQLDDLSLIEEPSDGPIRAMTTIAELFKEGKGPRRALLLGGSGSLKIDFRGEYEGRIEIGLVANPKSLAEALAPLTGIPLKGIRILNTRDQYRRAAGRDASMKMLYQAAEKLAPVTEESIP